MLAHLACAIERRRPITLEANIDSMGRESSTGAHLEFFETFEWHLDAGRLANAKKHLERMPPDLKARRYNAIGLLSLLEGDVFSARSFLRRADNEPFGPVHLAIRKNLYWEAYRDPEAASNNDRIDSAWSAVIEAFKRSHDAGMPSKDVSMFDLGVQRQVCNHPMYDRNRHAGMWEDVSDADHWRIRYLELVKKGVTDYLHRDLTEEFRGSSEPAATACSEDPEGCESDWQIGQAAGRVDGPFSQKRLGGLVHIELLLQDVLDSEVDGDLGAAADPAHGGLRRHGQLPALLLAHLALRPRAAFLAHGGLLHGRNRSLHARRARAERWCAAPTSIGRLLRRDPHAAHGTWAQR